MKAWFRHIATLLVLLMAASSASAQAPAGYATRTADEAAEACRNLQGGRFEGLASAPTYIVRSTWRPASAEQGGTCVVEGYVNPTVNFGLLLPAERWNGKYLVRGCGGSCGQVALDAICRWHAADGYACLHTDMGHRSTLVDNNWVANNLQGLVDFGYRATHVTTVAGKAIAEAFYATAPRRSYFMACSTGGRQGLIEAQRFPQDFDGVIAIAPTGLKPFDDQRLESEINPDIINSRSDGGTILPNRKALLVHQAVLQRCDMNDGLRDGLIGDPRHCTFDPAELQCKTSDARQCLTPAQVGVVRRFYNDLGVQRGSEFNWINAWLRPAPLPGETSKPLPWLGRGRGDPVVIDTLNSANHPDLRPFKRRGGKLILVHGWDDQSITPLHSVDYYETVTRTMGGPETTRDFARLFMVPGMDHCAGGKGASAIHYMKALEDWVERGQAPDALLGFHPKPGAPLDYFATSLPRVAPEWFEFSRLHAAWPASARAPRATAPHDGLPQIAKLQLPLAQELGVRIQDAEAFAIASFFPPASVAGHVSRTLWRLFFDHGIGAGEAAAALRAVPGDKLSPLARDVVARMQVELLSD